MPQGYILLLRLLSNNDTTLAVALLPKLASYIIPVHSLTYSVDVQKMGWDLATFLILSTMYCCGNRTSCLRHVRFSKGEETYSFFRLHRLLAHIFKKTAKLKGILFKRCLFLLKPSNIVSWRLTIRLCYLHWYYQTLLNLHDVL